MARLTDVFSASRPSALAQVAAIYLASRIVTLSVLCAAAAASGPLSRYGAAATVGDFILGWDANWYWIIADVGYPSELPLSGDGRPMENAWAFMPIYAYLAKIVSLPFGSWVTGAAIVSLVAGFGATYALYCLMRARLSHMHALWAVIFFANGPLAALFHVGYAEALFLFFLITALLVLVRRQFGWLYLLIPAMGYTRPGVLAFSLMLALYGIWRWTRRRVDPLPVSQINHIVATGLLGAVVGLSWPVIAGMAMGDPTAYLQTELSWRRNWLPESAAHFVPFDGWMLGLNFWFGQWHVPAWIGWTLFAALVIGTIWLLVRASYVRALGMEVRLFSASYLLYLVAVFFPQSSTLRLLVPLSPLWGAPAQIKPLWGRLAVLAGCLIYQAIWIFEMYAYGNSITRIP